MELSQLADVGEFIGGAAVLVTLVYLASQVRQSAQATRASAFQASTNEIGRVNQLLADDGDLSTIMLKGWQDPDSLSPLERIRFGFVINSVLRIYESIFYQMKQNAVEQEVWKSHEDRLLAILRLPGASHLWEESSELSFQPSLCRHVNELLETQGDGAIFSIFGLRAREEST